MLSSIRRRSGRSRPARENLEPRREAVGYSGVEEIVGTSEAADNLRTLIARIAAERRNRCCACAAFRPRHRYFSERTCLSPDSQRISLHLTDRYRTRQVTGAVGHERTLVCRDNLRRGMVLVKGNAGGLWRIAHARRQHYRAGPGRPCTRLRHEARHAVTAPSARAVSDVQQLRRASFVFPQPAERFTSGRQAARWRSLPSRPIASGVSSAILPTTAKARF
jgi:hypothetical protein